jgi:two-component system phosphate regulon sensor histidine kinase PhoR
MVALALIAALVVALAPRPLGVATALVSALAGGWLMYRPATEPAAVAAEPAPLRPPAEPEFPREWLEGIPSGVFLLDAQMLVVGVNQAALTLCHRRREEVEGVSLIRALREHNVAQVAREAAAVPREVDISGGQIVRATATRLSRPVAGAHYVLALEDLTDLRRAQRARSDLVANASHELRTPVTAALALAETLERGVPDEARRHDFHQRLTDEVGRLSDIIEGLLNLSRLEAGSDEFRVEPLMPGELLQLAAQRIEPLLGPLQSLELIDECGVPVAGDKERVLEVLANLLDNALRVTPSSGKVTIACYPGEAEVRFEVRDQGPGIILRDRARIFERFYTGDESRTAASKNSGLGLAIARHIVSRLGGRIWVADRTPGATLCFTLPIAAQPSTSEATPAASQDSRVTGS